MASCLSNNSSTLSSEPDPFAAIPSYLYSTMSGENIPAISRRVRSIGSRVHKISTGSASNSSTYSLSPPYESFSGSLEYIETLIPSRNPEPSGLSGSPGPFGSPGPTGSLGSPGPSGSLGSPGFSESSRSQFKPQPNRKTTNLFCETHSSPKGLFCSTCTATICPYCAGENHAGHDLNFIKEAIRLAQITNNNLQADIRMAMDAIQGSIASVQRRSEDIEKNSIQAASSVRSLINSFTMVLKGRETRLLQTIDQNRQTKGRCLSHQKENLQSAFYRLKSTADFLNEPMDHMNPVKFISANEKAKLQLRTTLARVPELEPCEEDDIRFTPPQECIMFTVANLGHLTQYNRKTPRELRQLAFREPFLCHSDGKKSEGTINRAIHGAPLVMVVMNPGPRPISSFGRAGDGDGELCRPWGVCCDRYGNIIVADRSNNRIQVFDDEGHFIFKFGSPGSGSGEFNKPAGITVNPAGHIVVADKDNHRIQIFTADGAFLRTFGKFGKENGEFNYPWDVACNVKGNIVVSDTKNSRVQLFSSSGVYLNKFTYEETGDMYLMTQLDSPRGVCFTPEGNILVSDFNNHRLAIINENMLECRVLGFQGSDNEGFERPQGVVCDDEGQIIVADSKNHRIKVMDRGGNLQYICGQSNEDHFDLDTPSGICLNPGGHIVVVDFGNSRIKIY